MAAPIQAAQMANFPFGVRSFGMPIIGETTGRVFFVDSTSPNKGDDSAHGSEPFAPFQTLDFAIGQCTANRGDRIYVLPGHTETVTTAAGINCDVAGVTILGIGFGRDRPRFTFSTSTAASIDINAASVSIRNMVFDLTGIDNLVTGFLVKASDFLFGENEVIVATAVGQAQSALQSDGNAHRMRLLHNLFSGTNNAGTVVTVLIDSTNTSGTEGIEVGWNRIIGNVSSAALSTTSSGGGFYSNLFVHDNKILTLGSAQQGYVYGTDGLAGSTGIVSDNQLAGTSIASLFFINTGVAPYPAPINNFGYDTDTPNANGVPVPIIGTQLSTSRSLIDEIIGAEFSYNRANYVPVTITFVAGTTGSFSGAGTHEILTVTGAVRLKIIPEVTVTLTSAGGPSLALGVETAGTGMLAATLHTALTAGKLWLSATPATDFAATSVVDRVISNGADVGYVITGGATVTGGTIIFHCWWEPINATGAVAASTGTVPL